MNRLSVLGCFVVLTGCATGNAGPQAVSIETQSGGQAVHGARCTVQTAARTLELESPSSIELTRGDGSLVIVCDKPGYRTAELQYRGDGAPRSGMGVQVGGGSGGVGVGLSFPIGGRLSEPYPARLVIEMTQR